MKKFAAVLVMCLVLIGTASAQYIADIDGWTWAKYSADTRAAVVIGYLVAMSTLYEFSVDGYSLIEKKDRTRENVATMQLLSALQDWAGYGTVTVGNIVNKVTEYYNYNIDNKNNKLYLVIPWLYDKEWW
jgi:fluoride ion exporter CrcB/FEX